MRAVFSQVLEVLAPLPVPRASPRALELTMRLETPPPLAQRPEQRLLTRPPLAPTREGVGDDLTASLALWRPRDRTLKAEETCGGEGRHGKGQGEA